MKSIDVEMDQYYLSVLENCLDIVRRDESNEVKCQAIEPIKNILRNRIITGVLNLKNNVVEDMYQLFLENVLFAKVSKGLRGELLKSLGLLVWAYSDFPATIKNVSKILDICSHTLKKNFENNTDPDLSAIAGSFSCLDKCLFYYENQFQNHVDTWKYLFLSILAVNQDNLHRYTIVSKALRLLKNHGILFRIYIGLNSMKIYNAILTCYHSDKKLLQKHSEDALMMTIRQIAAASIIDHLDVAQSTVVSLKMDFIAILEKPTSSNDDMILAVKGIAIIAPAIADMSKSSIATSAPAIRDAKDGNGLTSILQLLVRSAQYFIRTLVGVERVESVVSIDNTNASAENYVLRRKTEFLLAMSSLISSSEAEVDDFVMDYLRGASVECVLGYSKLSSKLKPPVNRSIALLLHGLNGNPALFSDLSNTLLTVLFLRTIGRRDDGTEDTISGDYNLELVNPVTGEQEFRLLYVYTSLWMELLSPSDKETLQALSFSRNTEYNNTTAISIYDSLMTLVLKNVRKFDLTYAIAGDDIVPTNAFDQEMLLNLVSFLELLLPHRCASRISYWMPILLPYIIQVSIKHPFVSALYRFVNCILNICSTLKLLDLECTAMHNTEENSQKDLLAQVKSYLLKLSSDLNKFQQPELLSCLLSLLLRASMYVPSIDVLVPSVVSALSSGLQVVLAVEKLSTINNEDITPHLPLILPLLEKYIISSSTSTSTSIPLEQKTSLVKKSHKKKTSSNIINSADPSVSLDDQISFNLKRDILRYLGRLGGLNKHIFVEPRRVLQDTLSWGDLSFLEIKLPLPKVVSDISSKASTSKGATALDHEGLTMTFPLDKILPRIILLCNQSVDRQLRTNAAESLHSLIIYMVGKAASNPARRLSDKNSIFAVAYSKIFPTVLKLASSEDIICRQLFSTLLQQLIHWFSGLGQVHADEAETLQTALLDGLRDTSEASVKSLCAAGLEEYFKWTIKQSSKQEMRSLDMSSPVDSLLRNLFVLALHPSEVSRRSAASVFNRIYKQIREETSLIHRYALRIVYTMLQSLRRSSNDEDSTKVWIISCIKFKDALWLLCDL